MRTANITFEQLEGVLKEEFQIHVKMDEVSNPIYALANGYMVLFQSANISLGILWIGITDGEITEWVITTFPLYSTINKMIQDFKDIGSFIVEADRVRAKDAE